MVCRSDGGQNRASDSVSQSNQKRLSVWQPGAQQRCSKKFAITRCRDSRMRVTRHLYSGISAICILGFRLILTS